MGMTRARHTLEFRFEAVRLAKSSPSMVTAVKTLGVSELTLHN